MPNNTALISGAAGFIGHHLAGFLKQHGQYDRVVGVDLVTPESRGYVAHCDAFVTGDLRDALFVDALYRQVKPRHVYHLAANVGGLGHMHGRDAEIMLDNGRIDWNVVGMAPEHGVERLLFASSSVVYPAHLTLHVEADAWPARPTEGGYGLQKLATEELCRYLSEKHDGFETRVVRFSNTYGPEGSWNDGREKAPAAMCRKVRLAEDGGEIEVWGDGNQARSFLFIEDALRGIHAVMVSSHSGPLNVGSDQLVTINDLVSIVSGIAGKSVRVRYDLDKPQGVRARSSDISYIAKTTGWRPIVSLEDGLRATYDWISQQVSST